MATQSALPAAVSLDNVTPSQLILRYLALEGTTTLFGIPGGALMQMLYALRVEEDAFRFVVCRHETAAAYMADGYARASDGLGVVLATSGPGATNALTGTMNAHASGTPLLAISGEVKEMYFGMGYLQEGIDGKLDIDDVYDAAVGYSAVVDNPANTRTLVETALRSALAAPSGASHLSLPSDVAGTPIQQVSVPTTAQQYRVRAHFSDPAALDKALDHLLAAQRPLIFLGNGCRRALRGERTESLAAFAERFAIPVMTTPEAKGVFPESHALSLRNYGVSGSTWTTDYMSPEGEEQYDCLLVIGSALGEFAATKTTLDPWGANIVPDGPFMHVDADSTALGRIFPVDVGIVAEAAPTIDRLVEQAAEREVPGSAEDRRAFVDAIKKTSPAPAVPATPAPGTVHPATVMQALNDGLPAGGHVFVDSGNCVGWCNAYLRIDPPTQMHSALAMGPMGFAVAAVVGAKLADPAATCVAVVGDGALLMQGSEISTAAQHQVGAIWIVLDDGDLAMVSQGMGEFFPQLDWKRYYAIGQTDIVGYATALGAAAVEVTSPDAVAGALAQAIKQAEATSQPQVVSVKVDPAAAPPYYTAKIPLS